MNNFLFAFLIYSSTLVLVPQAIIYTIIALFGLSFWAKTLYSTRINGDDIFYIVFILLSLITFFVGKPFAIDDVSKSINSIIPYSIFIVATINFSKKISKDVLTIILYFILFESCLAIVQYTIGVPYFIKPISRGAQEFGESEYLYYNKVFGLSPVTSVLSLKIFVGVLLVHFLKTNTKYRNLFYTILLLGLLVTFNRSAIVATFIFLLIIFFQNLKSGSLKVKIGLIFLSITVVFLIVNNYNLLLNQFFRGEEVDFSGRDFIFTYYINFIDKHPMFGNFFTKHWVELSFERIYHAHNSYLQTFANMGLIFGVPLFAFLFSKINKKNLPYILPILVYSLFQYGILWGVSFLDIIFFYILFNFNNKYVPKTHSI